LFPVIVYYGAIRPDAWAQVLTAIAAALVAIGILATAGPRPARPS
jgi:hypothetical protein